MFHSFSLSSSSTLRFTVIVHYMTVQAHRLLQKNTQNNNNTYGLQLQSIEYGMHDIKNE